MADEPGPVASPSLRRVAVPTEHGGWSLTVEPVLLGLLAAPSAAGLALGGGAVVAFLARTPLRFVLVDRLRDRTLPRTVLARRVLVIELAVVAVLVLAAVALSATAFWAPFVVAAVPAGVAIGYDARSRSRRLLAELAGSIAIASVAAAIGLAGGLAAAEAWGLWLVAAARSVGAVFFVRLQLRRRKGLAARQAVSVLAQVAAVTAVAAGAALGAVPAAAVIAIVAMATAHLWLQWVRVPAVPVIGAQQVVLGLGVVVTAALGVRFPR